MNQELTHNGGSDTGGDTDVLGWLAFQLEGLLELELIWCQTLSSTSTQGGRS